jgi:hypothetical protein
MLNTTYQRLSDLVRPCSSVESRVESLCGRGARQGIARNCMKSEVKVVEYDESHTLLLSRDYSRRVTSLVSSTSSKVVVCWYIHLLVDRVVQTQDRTNTRFLDYTRHEGNKMTGRPIVRRKVKPSSRKSTHSELAFRRPDHNLSASLIHFADVVSEFYIRLHIALWCSLAYIILILCSRANS